MAHVYQKGVEIVPGFRLVEHLGRGGFGEVWKAIAPGGTEAAIKIVSLVERYGFKEFRAIQRVKQIRHPNLVPIIGFWLKNEEGKFFDPVDADSSFARRAQDMELILAMGMGEKNLLDRLRECQREGKNGIPVDELINYMQDSAKAIDYLNQPIHESEDGAGGIQHCDIKPQNILIVGGSAQVCDFGLARVLGDVQMTTAKGTAAYMAPELILDNKPSKATDQYFLAISYVELRTGSLPLDISSPASAIWAHAQGKLDLSKLPTGEQQVIRKATSLKPENRYGTVVEFVRALRHACVRTTPVRPSFRPTRTDELAPGSEIVPGYRLIRMLGKGGYGVVWEALAPGGKRVALKVIRNLDGTQGRQEFRALELIKAVDHNHLMELHAYWLLDRDGNVIPDALRDQPNSPEASTLVIASKLAAQNLLQRLGECQTEGMTGIPIGELIAYMKQAAQAIDYLNEPRHQLGDRRVSIQHRDIKPENVLLAAGVVKVGDFGLAKVLEGTSAVIHGESAGLTLAYAAPEMFTNLVTRWSDQYSLAITYYRLRTGVLPFPAGSKANDIIKMHMRGILDLSRLDSAERDVIARATSAKPEERYADCEALVDALEQAIAPGALGDQKDPTLDVAMMTAGKNMAAPGAPVPAPAVVSAAHVSTAVEPAVRDVPTPLVPVEPRKVVRAKELERISKSKEIVKPEPASKAAAEPATKPAPEPPKPTPEVPAKPASKPPTKAAAESAAKAPPDPPAKSATEPEAKAAPATPAKPAPEPAPAKAPSKAAVAPPSKSGAEQARKAPAKDSKVAAPGTPAPSSVNRPGSPRRPPSATWKGSSPHRHRRRRSSPLVPVMLTGVLVIALGVCGVLFWFIMESNKKQRGEQARADVEKLINEKQFEKAWQVAKDRDLPQDDRDELQPKVRDAWVNYGKQELAQRNFANAKKTAEEAHKRISNDPQVEALLRQAETAAQAKSLLDGGRWPDAVNYIDDEEKKGLPAELAGQLRNDAVERRLNEAEEALAVKQLSQVEAITTDILRRYPKTVRALLLRGNAHVADQSFSKAIDDFIALGLSDGKNATLATLPLLLARLELFLTPKGEAYIFGLAPSAANCIQDYLAYGDHAVLIAEKATALEQIRALSLSMRLYRRAARELSLLDVDRAKARAKAEELFSRAKKVAEKHPSDWASSLELAQQLVALLGTGKEIDADKRGYRDEARKQLERVQQRAPRDVVQKRVEPLLKALSELT